MKQQTTAAPSTPLAMLEIVKLNKHFVSGILFWTIET